MIAKRNAVASILSGVKTVRSAARKERRKVNASVGPKKKKRRTRKGGTCRSTWKRREREVAGLFGQRRTPLSGGASGHGTRSDTLHPRLYVEHKLRNEKTTRTTDNSLWKLWDATKRKAKKEGKIPVIALSRKGSPGFLLVCNASDLPLVSCEMKDAAPF